MTLDDLKASAPRSFDKTLLDLIAAVQSGGQPIAVSRTDGMAPEIGGAMLAIANRIASLEDAISAGAEANAGLNRVVVDLVGRIEVIEAANRILAAEAARRVAA